MNDRTGGSAPDPEELARLRARADAGDRNAAGRLGELLAKSGDREGALRLWARTYGDHSSATKRLAELFAEDGDLARAVEVWKFSDAVWQNPAGLHAEYLNSLDPEERSEWDDDPEDWAFIEAEQLAELLADRGDEASLAELRALAASGDLAAKRRLRRMES